MLHVSRVVGLSMAPTLNDGDFVLALAPRWAGAARPGDIVVVKHAELGIIVKRVSAVAADGALALAGDNPLSRSPQALGSVPREALLGRAWLRLARPPGSVSRLARGAS
jgi:hypothetical protein